MEILPFSEEGKEYFALLPKEEKEAWKKKVEKSLISFIEGLYEGKLEKINKTDAFFIFYFGKGVVKELENRKIKKGFVEFFSNYYLGISLERLSDELGIKIKKNKYGFLIPVWDYLKLDLEEEKLKLVNNIVRKKKVFLPVTKEELFKGEILRKLIEREIEKSKCENKRILEKIKEFLEKNKLAELEKLKEVKVGAFPPCMAEFISKLEKGEDLPHMARFFLATFLNAIKMKEEKIIDIFRNAPDFDEKVTRYQVEYIKNKKLAPPTCKKIKSYGFCNRNCNVNSPFGYYLREVKKNEKRF